MVTVIEEISAFCMGLLTILVILYLGPGLGESMSTSLPINESGDFASATTGADVWTSGVAILGAVIVIAAVAIAIRALKGLKD
ncbi:MAG: hypothetical protein M0R51_05310 [Clostridia bacterium]|jgi:hypothetical protein|nr:hypothetical protein [Clostridia bacterium]